MSTQELPPIAQLLPLLSNASSLALSAVRLLTRTLAQLLATLSYPVLVLSPLPLVLYICAPLLVFGRVAFDALVFVPLSIMHSVLSVIYPVYVFVGAACIAGAVIGAAARALAHALNAAALESPKYDSPQVRDANKPVIEKKRSRSRQ